MGGKTRKTPKIKGKLQEINLLGSAFPHKDIEINLNTPLGCSSTYLGLYLLLKITKTQDKQFTRETGWGQRKSPGELTQPPSTRCGFLTVNEEQDSYKWYFENGVKNPSLKFNISIYSQSIVTKGLTGSTSLKHLSTQPVHIPLMSSASLTRVSGESGLTRVTVSTSALTLQGDRSLTERWPVSGEQEGNQSLKGQVPLVQDPGLPLPWGQVLHSPTTCWPLGQGWERNTEFTLEAAVQDRGDITRESLSRLDMVHKLCHWFPIMGKRKNHSINHDGNMGCLEKWGLSYAKHWKNILAFIIRNKTRGKIKCLQRFTWC